MVHNTLETYTHDQLEAFTHDELEMIYFLDSLAAVDATAVMDVGKPALDSQVMSDVVTVGIGKVLAESITFSELFTKQSGTAFSESLTSAEATLFNVGKAAVDSMSFSETFTNSMARAFADAVLLVDSFSPAWLHYVSLSDVLVISDVHVSEVGKGTSDTQIIADSNVFAVSKVSVDTQTIVDSFARVASYVRSLSDSGVIADDISNALGKVLSDALAESDVITSTTIIHTDPLASQKDIAALLADPSSETLPWMPWVAIGDDDTEFDENLGTELWGEIHRKRGNVTVTANTYFVRATFGQDEPTGDDLEIKEIGIFDASSGGVMGKRWVLATPVDKDNVDEIVVECAVTILHGDTPEVLAEDELQDELPQEDVIRFELTRALDLTDVMPIADSILKSVDKSFSGVGVGDLMTIVDVTDLGFPTSNIIYNDVLVNSPHAYVVTDASNAICGVYSGLFIFDVSDVTNPRRVSYLELTPGYQGVFRSPFRLQKVGDTIFASNTYGIFSIDVSEPFIPVQLDYVDLTTGLEGRAPNIAILGSVAYTTHYQHGIRLADISDPNNLSAIAMGMDVGGLKDWETFWRYKYLGIWGHVDDPPDHDGTSGPDPYYHVNAGNVGRWWNNSFPGDIRASGSSIYALFSPALIKFDSTAPYYHTKMCTAAFVDDGGASYNHSTVAFDLDGDIAYIYQIVPDAHANLRLQEIDTVNNARTNNCSITIEGGVFGMRIYSEVLVVGDYVYISSGRGISIVDKILFTEIAYISGYGNYGFRGMTVYDDHLYICWYEPGWGGIYGDTTDHEVRIYDLADKTAPALVGTCRWDI